MKPLYPPGPLHVPADFTLPTPRYRLGVALVLASLIVSLLFYLALVVGSAWLCYWLITLPRPPRIKDDYEFFRIVAIICSGLLFLYLLKGLFKVTHRDQSLLVEIKEADQPELFAFIRQICAETGAPLPRRVYVSPEVNAAVFYQSSFLSLFLPTPKHLLIGLGLVNALNLSEFKAVLAHEFGHFSQKSMKVSAYVYIANKVLADIIYGRDLLDTIVNHVKRWDLRIAIFAWIFLGVLWTLRKILTGIFKAINIFQLSLMRQMEFNADRVAVSVAGSDAMVHSLLRCGYADQAFRQLGGDLWTAADHNFYSVDIFHHQMPAGEFLRRRVKNPKLGEPPPERGPTIEVFKPGEGELGIPPMWSTHPPNRDREANAKAIYIDAAIDQRSAWLLFRNRQELCAEVSRRYYTAIHKPEKEIVLADPLQVQSLLDEEYSETAYPERCHGFYDNRYLELVDVKPLVSETCRDSDDPGAILHELESIFGPAMPTWVKENCQRLDEMDLLSGLRAGSLTLKNKSLEFRGESHPPADIPGLIEHVQQELDKDQAYKAKIDALVFVDHRRLANQLDGSFACELDDRYAFHLGIQPLHRQSIQATQEFQAALNFAGNRPELTQEDFAGLRELLRQAAARLFDILEQSQRLTIPALKNLHAGDCLRPFLLQKPVIASLAVDDKSIDGKWIQQFSAQLAEVQDRLKRLLFKSLGGILALQERIVDQVKNRKPPETILAH